MDTERIAEAAKAESQAVAETVDVVQTTQLIRGAIEPRDRLRAKTIMPEPVAHESLLHPKNRTILSDTNIYHLLRYSLKDGGFTFTEQSIKQYVVSGDHLYIAEVNTGAPIYVRLGQISNPWIRIRRGMTLRRTFDTVTFGMWDTTVRILPSQFQDVIAYASVGPLFEEEGEFDEGVRAPLSAAGSATAVLQRLFDPLYTGAPTPGLFTLGKTGGYFQVFNTDVANTCRIYSPDTFALGSAGIPLLPGQALTVPFSQRIMDAVNTLGLVANRWYIDTPGGTCAYVVFVSNCEMDILDAQGTRPGGINS
jgi:hypothetical protein